MMRLYLFALACSLACSCHFVVEASSSTDLCNARDPINLSALDEYAEAVWWSAAPP